MRTAAKEHLYKRLIIMLLIIVQDVLVPLQSKSWHTLQTRVLTWVINVTKLERHFEAWPISRRRASMPV